MRTLITKLIALIAVVLTINHKLVAISAPSCVADTVAQQSHDRNKLTHIREIYRNQLYAIEQSGSVAQYPYAHICKQISQDMRAYLARIYSDAIHKMGPKPCRMCLFATRSLSRDESGLVTDLEVGLLLEHKTIRTMRYAQRLIQHIADRIYVLGESSDVESAGLRLDEAGHAFVYQAFTHRYAKQSLRHGSRLWIATPCEMAAYHDDNWIEQQNTRRYVHNQRKKRHACIQHAYHNEQQHYPTEYHHELYERITKLADMIYSPLSPSEQHEIQQIRDLVQNPIYISGDRALLEMYTHKRDAVLNTPYSGYKTIRQRNAYEVMCADLKRHAYLRHPTTPDVVNVKKHIYRPAQSFVTQLARWANITPSDTITTLDQLYHAGHINKACYRDIAQLIDFALHLRLRQQAQLETQIGTIPTCYPIWKQEYRRIIRTISKLEKKQKIYEQKHQYNTQWHDITKKLNAWIAYKNVYQKQMPQRKDAILSQPVLNAYTHHYLPILRKLYATATSFVSGNRDAFKQWR